MKIYNSLSRQVEEFVPLKGPTSHKATKGAVGMYTCGPTVYDFVHIGNFRTYTMADVLQRILRYNGLEVNYVMNITDVGHLTGDNLGDADLGEDRIEVAARKQKRSAYDVAAFYTQQFEADFDKLNLVRPRVWCKATDHIAEQIALVERLLDKGFAYKINDGIYFDTGKWPRYGELSTLESVKEGARVEVNQNKKNPKDFALWKFSVPSDLREMEWDSPWGRGFPGWHIECSAMSMKYLGESFDIHTGGEDLRSTHHPNEIAQSEAATGKPFVKCWMHGAFLLVDRRRMSKSLGNNYTLTDLEQKGFSPMALRYLYLTAHYRSPLNFTWSSLTAAQNAYDKLKEFVKSAKGEVLSAKRKELSQEKMKKMDGFRKRFLEAVNNDLGFPQGLAVVWEMLKSSIPDYDKSDLLMDWDQILGLDLANIQTGEEVPTEVRELAASREQLRQAGKFVEGDEVRMKIERLGWRVEDSQVGPKFKHVK